MAATIDPWLTHTHVDSMLTEKVFVDDINDYFEDWKNPTEEELKAFKLEFNESFLFLLAKGRLRADLSRNLDARLKLVGY